MTTFAFPRGQWALILGGSSGFGLATAQKLAKHGMNIAVVHRDRRGAMSTIEAGFEVVRSTGVEFVSWNLDALSEDGQKTVLDGLEARLMGGAEPGNQKVRLLLHSIAFGNLKTLAPVDPEVRDIQRCARARLASQVHLSEESLGSALTALSDANDLAADVLSGLVDSPQSDDDAFLDEEDFARTIYSMGTSLLTWTRAIHTRGLFAEDARVIGLTSEGNEVAWRGYAAVSAAKVVLESVVRSMAVEFARYGIRSNVVQAGVTETPALRLIPGSRQMKAKARLRNPFGRLTAAADVANFITLLCLDEASWVNGAILRVDGGEHVAG